MKRGIQQRMNRGACSVMLLVLGVATAHAQITTRTDAVGNLLNAWAAKGEAAGLTAFRYENRDGNHSPFEIQAYPQLRAWSSSGEETGAAPVMGPASQVRKETLFGNCSMAAPADKGGSLPRIYLLAQGGYEFLTAQYLRNNLFFYPEHQDHDPGYLGRGGWGDLYPANVPSVVISQGSSFSDQPFLRAFFSTAAALPPETQDKLIQSRLLVPTLQSIFRRSNRIVKSEEDYFTGKAHPVVFDATQLDEEKMVQTAHLMSMSRVPPIALVEVVSESASANGKNFFERDEVKNEALGTTPFSVARVFRSSAFQHEMVVKANRSGDVLNRPVQLRWVLLQGDANRVQIEPNENGSQAKLKVSWHPEMDSSTGLATHRVDIGVFAGNGFTWSAPAIISLYMLPNEARFYDASGRLQEICYEAGNPDLGLPALNDLRWLTLARKLTQEKKDRGLKLLAEALGDEAQVRLKVAADDLAKAQENWRKLNAAPERKAEADSALQALQAQLRYLLEKPVLPGGPPLWRNMEQSLSKIADRADLYASLLEDLPQLARNSSKTTATADVEQACQRLVDFMMFDEVSPAQFRLRYKLENLTAGERYQLRQLNLVLLSQVLLPEFLERNAGSAYVDVRLSHPKNWRDIYHYGKDGAPLGWTRVTKGRAYEFDLQGRLLPSGRNRNGPPAVEVKYVPDEKSERLIFMPR